MVIKERSNLLYIELFDGENVIKQFEDIIREYKIIEGKIHGHGILTRLEYGILKQLEPVFFGKKMVESLITVSSMDGFIINREYTLSFTAVDQDENIHTGRFLSGQVASKFAFTIDIYKTE